MKIITLATMIALAPVGSYGPSIASEPHITIKVSNPYSFDVSAEVKCDWEEHTRKFSYEELMRFASKTVTEIRLPRRFYNCEIWPEVLFWGSH